MRTAYISIMIIAATIVLGQFNTHASIPNPEFLIYENRQSVTDEDLRKLAVEHKMIPEVADKEFFHDEIKKKNTITAWIVTNRDDKLKMMDSIKNMYKQNKNVEISFSSEYYVNEINGVVYNSIMSGYINNANLRGLGIIFKTIAIMDGDYNNGVDKLELARSHLGTFFETFKSLYPEKYDNLLKANGER